MSRKSNICLAIIILIISSLAPGGRTQEVFDYQVWTEPAALTAISTPRGTRYTFGDEFSIDDKGAPEIPFKIIRVILPAATRIDSVEVTGSGIITLARGIEYSWCEGDIKTEIDGQFVPAPRDMTIYSSNADYPGKYFDLLDEGHAGSQHMATFSAYPIQYRPASGEVILVREINLHIFLGSELSAGPDRVPDGATIAGHIVNGPLVQSSPFQNQSVGGSGPIPGGMILGVGAEYLIITSAELAPAFYPLAFWKNQKGLVTEIVLIEDILTTYSGEDPPAQLRAYLQEAYANGAGWVLLGGDEDVIPTRYAYPGNTNQVPALYNQQLTDLYYADLTGTWDVDGDGVYGEYNQDAADIYPEVYVGRVPAINLEEAAIWVDKAIQYEQNPNHGDYAYLTKGLFITADQMVDLDEHNTLANLMPANFAVDASRCTEMPSGGATAPTQPTAETVIAVMNEGWGFVSNLNHGAIYYYAAMTPGYNGAPRSNVYSDTMYFDNYASCLARMADSSMYGVHYSISCYTAAYDFDKEIFRPGPFLTNNTCMEAWLFLPDKGGVAYLGNTRWGWVTSSFLIEKKFIEYAYDDNSSRLGVAEALSKIYYPTKRDLAYGHNVFGDPEMSMWSETPVPLTLSVPQDIAIDTNYVTVTVNTPDGPAADIDVCLWKPGEIYLRGTTDEAGSLEVPLDIVETGEIYVTASGRNKIPALDTVSVFLQSGLDTEVGLPQKTYLDANFPNPFNSATEIRFSLASSGRASLAIYDISGRFVVTLMDEDLPAGAHKISWNGRNETGRAVASGMYLYKLITESSSFVRKMVLLK